MIQGKTTESSLVKMEKRKMACTKSLLMMFEFVYYILHKNYMPIYVKRLSNLMEDAKKIKITALQSCKQHATTEGTR